MLLQKYRFFLATRLQTDEKQPITWKRFLSGTKLVYFFEMDKFLGKNLFFATLSCQKKGKYAEKHIFSQNYLVVLKKSSTFAPCFSWY